MVPGIYKNILFIINTKVHFSNSLPTTLITSPSLPTATYMQIYAKIIYSALIKVYWHVYAINCIDTFSFPVTVLPICTEFCKAN